MLRSAASPLKKKGKSKEELILQAMKPKEREKKIDEHLRMINFQMTCFSAVGFVLIVTYNESCFNQETLEFYEAHELCPQAFYLKWCAWFSFLFFLTRLYAFYRLLCIRKMMLWGYSTQFQAFMKTNLHQKFLIELVVNAIMPLPSPLGWELANLFIIFFLVLRSYLVLRLIRDYSNVYRYRHSTRTRKYLGKFVEADFRIGYTSVFKTFLYQHTIVVTSLIVLAAVSFMSYILYLAERETWILDGETYRVKDHDGQLPPVGSYQNPLSYFSNAVWFVCLSMTSLGYGDVVPVTTRGRFFAAFTIMIGCALLALLIGVVANLLAPNKPQRVVLNWTISKRLKEQGHFYAALVIQTAWRTKRSLQQEKGKELASKKFEIRRAIRPWLRKLREVKRKLQESERRTHGKDATNEKMWSQMDAVMQQMAMLVKEVEERTGLDYAASCEAYLTAPAPPSRFVTPLPSPSLLPKPSISLKSPSRSRKHVTFDASAV